MRSCNAREVVKQLMKLGLSFADIASKIGVTEMSVRKWRTGERKPYYTTYEKLLLILSEEKKGVKNEGTKINNGINS